ncbi:MAG: ABC transporter substrate-binding protein [Deltaproteobacteria bacterium]|nr:ABC transporter substrate-binding protein [Deltaproteobacteria bacterium]
MRIFKMAALLAILELWALGSIAFAAAASPDLLNAKKEAEAKGYTFITAHDEILAKAKDERRLRVLSSLQPDALKEMAKAFMQKYPFIDVHAEESTGTEAAQRLLLGLEAGMVRDWDTFNLSADFYDQLAPHTRKFDILGMAKHGVLSIPTGMIDPHNRNIIAWGSSVSAIAYNRTLIPLDKVPNKWEDFLKPEFKGRKLLVDIRPTGMVSLVQAMGEQWVINYARGLKEQEPIWVRGHSRSLTAMVAGEYGLFQLTNYNSCMRRLVGTEAVFSPAPRPYAALLWLEFQASPEGQKIIDEHDMLTSSMYAPGSAVEELTREKKVSVNDWDTYSLTSKWMKMIIEAFGFPRAAGPKKK